MIVFGADCFGPQGPLVNGLSLVDNAVAKSLWPERQMPLVETTLHERPVPFDIRPTSELNRVGCKYFYEIRPLGFPEQWLGHYMASFKSPFQDISPDTLQAVRDGRATVLINDSMEGFHLSRVITPLLDRIDAAKLPRERVWYLTSGVGAQESARALQCPFPVFALDAFRTMISEKLRIQPESFVDPEQARTAPRRKHFVCLNRVPRGHRVALVGELAARDLLQYGLVSFPGMEQQWSDAARYGVDDQRLETLRNLAPLVLDYGDFEINFALIFEPQHYLDTVFSIVSETHFNSREVLFRSEKIYKPIANLHPFILVGSSGMLSSLRDLGFQTFSPFIDESYDSEIDDRKRMGMLLAEIERLCRMDINVLQEWYLSISPILLYNYKLLKNSSHVHDNLHAAMIAFNEE
jgi:hypothetical protein